MNIKAQGLFNAAIWIEQTHGQNALRDVLRACKPETRDRYTSATAINWHPVEEFVDLLSVVEKQLGKGDGRLAIEIGAAGARVNNKGMLIRLAMYVSKPEMMVKRVSSFWRQFNDAGDMNVYDVSERGIKFEVVGIDPTYELFCLTIVGWSQELVKGAGGRLASAKHVSCKGRGNDRCVWDVRWAPVAGSDGKIGL
ncbi:MAG: hypothetical protein ACHREM_18835 [Polyangiales bacterium]